MSALPTTTDASFATDVLDSSTPVLVEFTATWCPPCKMVAPVLERIAAENTGRLRVLAIDADENPETVRAYAVMGMPTMALFVDGKRVTQVVGARSMPALMKEFEPHLAARG